jgi:hypothetical protein
LWMIALAGNFYFFAPRITAYLAAILLAVWNIAAAWNVRAFLVLLVYHDNSSDRCCSGFSIPWQGASCRRADDLPRRFLGPWVKHIGDQWCPPFEVQTLIADSLFFRRQFDTIGLLGTVAIHQTCKIICVDRIR